MFENTEFSRIKCGNIFILSDDNFSLVCEFCEHDFYSFEEFRLHIKEHFPKSIPNSKTEHPISCANGFESITPDIHYGITSNSTDNEHFPETAAEIKIEDSDCESIPPEIHDEMVDFKDIINCDTSSESVIEDFGSSRLNDNQFTDEIIQNKQSERKLSKLANNLQPDNENSSPVPLRIIRIKVNKASATGSNYSSELKNIETYRGAVHKTPDNQTDHSNSESL